MTWGFQANLLAQCIHLGFPPHPCPVFYLEAKAGGTARTPRVPPAAEASPGQHWGQMAQPPCGPPHVAWAALCPACVLSTQRPHRATPSEGDARVLWEQTPGSWMAPGSVLEGKAVPSGTLGPGGTVGAGEGQWETGRGSGGPPPERCIGGLEGPVGGQGGAVGAGEGLSGGQKGGCIEGHTPHRIGVHTPALSLARSLPHADRRHTVAVPHPKASSLSGRAGTLQAK